MIKFIQKIKHFFGNHDPASTGYGNTWEGYRYLICKICHKHYRVE